MQNLQKNIIEFYKDLKGELRLYLGANYFKDSIEECTSKLSGLTNSDGINDMQQFWNLLPNNSARNSFDFPKF